MARCVGPAVVLVACYVASATGQQATAFDHNPHAAAAKMLRRFDEAAKVPDRAVPDLRTYRAAMQRCLLNPT